MLMPREGMEGVARFISLPLEPGDALPYGRSAIEFCKNAAGRVMGLKRYITEFRPDLIPVTGIWLSRFDTLTEIEEFVKRTPWMESRYQNACAT